MTALLELRNVCRSFGGVRAIHNVSLDSKGNIYTTETYTGARVQKFTYKGLGNVGTPEGNHLQ